MSFENLAAAAGDAGGEVSAGSVSICWEAADKLNISIKAALHAADVAAGGCCFPPMRTRRLQRAGKTQRTWMLDKCFGLRICSPECRRGTERQRNSTLFCWFILNIPEENVSLSGSTRFHSSSTLFFFSSSGNFEAAELLSRGTELHKAQQSCKRFETFHAVI